MERILRNVTILQRVSASPARWCRVRKLQDTTTSQLVDASGNPIPVRFTLSWWKTTLSIPKDKWVRLFLPEGYPQTVHPFYLPFASWNFAQMVFGSASGVLSTQSILYGLGLSSDGLALSSTLNWILKDGLGQFGGIWIVSLIGGRFDVEPKRYHIFAVVLLIISCILEILVPLAPHYFVLVASIANIFKNVSWMVTSATRAQIHKQFARHDNMGDITGKSAAQNTLASLIGTGLGIILSTMFLSRGGVSPVEGVVKCLLVVVPLSLISLFADYQSCLYAVSTRLNLQRLDILFYHSFTELFGKTKVFNPSILHSLSRYILSPETVTKRESFVCSRRFNRLASVMNNVPLYIEPPLKDTQLQCLEPDRSFWIEIDKGASLISIWFDYYANDETLFAGILTACLLRYFIARGINGIALGKVEEIAQSLVEPYREALIKRGWSLDQVYLGTRHPLKITKNAD